MAHDGSAPRWLVRASVVVAAATASLSVASPTTSDPGGPRAASGPLTKAKGPDEPSTANERPLPDTLLGTLVHTHTNEHLPLGTRLPDDGRDEVVQRRREHLEHPVDPVAVADALGVG